MEWIELYCGIAWFALLLHATPLLEERSCAQGSSPLVTNDNGNFTSSLKNHVAHSIEYTPPPLRTCIHVASMLSLSIVILICALLIVASGIVQAWLLLRLSWELPPPIGKLICFN